jgi:hypothetical protein
MEQEPYGTVARFKTAQIKPKAMSNKQFNRRRFVKLAGIAGAAIPMTSLIGCNTTATKSDTGFA